MVFKVTIAILISFSVCAKQKTQSEQTKKIEFLPKPSLKVNQAAVFFDEKYEVIDLTEQSQASFSSKCFKEKKISCDAYKAYKQESPLYSKKAYHESMTNPAALFCEGQGGRNLVGSDYQKKELNLCRFKDGSMVVSWDLYFKFYPPKVIK